MLLKAQLKKLYRRDKFINLKSIRKTIIKTYYILK